MQIKNVMTKKAEYVSPSATVKEVAQKMHDCKCGAILIGENDRLTGMVTDRDITLRVIAEGKSPEKTTAGDIMSKNIFYCFEDQTLEEAAERMERHKIRRLAVLNREKRLVGLISLSDIAAATDEPSLVNRIAQFASKQSYAA